MIIRFYTDLDVKNLLLKDNFNYTVLNHIDYTGTRGK